MINMNPVIQKSKKLLAGLLATMVFILACQPGTAYALNMNRDGKKAYDIINNNQPNFTAEEKKNTKALEHYIKLDE